MAGMSARQVRASLTRAPMLQTWRTPAAWTVSHVHGSLLHSDYYLGSGRCLVLGVWSRRCI